jgi:predicted Zn-dependent peptidase
LTPAFADKADAFFKWHSEKMNDGVLILVTDMDEAELKKLLLNYVGGFKTMESASRRPSLQYQPISGWSTHLVDGETESIDVVISAAMPLTLDNFVTADIATMILEKSLASSLTETGMYPMVSNSFHLAPKNRLSLMVSVGLISKMGYASHIEHLGTVEALAIVRNSLQDLAQTNIPDQYLAACKAYQKNLFALRKNEPSYWLEAIALRYLDGKDYTTGYASKIDAVSVEDIRSVLRLLDKGSCIEYIINRK